MSGSDGADSDVGWIGGGADGVGGTDGAGGAAAAGAEGGRLRFWFCCCGGLFLA